MMEKFIFTGGFVADVYMFDAVRRSSITPNYHVFVARAVMNSFTITAGQRSLQLQKTHRKR